MPCTSPRNKATAGRSIRFNPYTRPYTSSNDSIAPIIAPLTRTLALYFDEEVAQVALDNTLEWMGSAMFVNESHTLEGTRGSLQDVPMPNIDLTENENRPTFLAANFIASDVSHVSHHMGRLSPDKRKLVRSLEKVVNKCIDRKCEGDHPTTDLLRERIYAALEGAVLGIEVDEIMRRHASKAENSAKDDDRHKLATDTDNNSLIPPTAQCIINGMRRGLFSLGTVLTAQSEPCGLFSFRTVPEPLQVIHRSGALLCSPAGMPGEYPTA
ncbi:uncharacterized protein HD556DRAFT_1437961 [Suillus plorans]|uniref:Uncharacterized protein n=1 Tax=Suillus plorans TaxID=116603 RepID=A0A9P7DTT2_9AGAM|nr:uncharacterized protein HD556DRAFT_1437961 [Suillus plorans]KAG1802902.1 hypothetical protein HD556DRAFT_1437961 [Suillus plorans]